MQKFLPILIVVAFPVLYMGAMCSSTATSLLGIVVLFLGMSGPIIKRISE